VVTKLAVQEGLEHLLAETSRKSNGVVGPEGLRYRRSSTGVWRCVRSDDLRSRGPREASIQGNGEYAFGEVADKRSKSRYFA
jgi:hypothetical protein